MAFTRFYGLSILDIVFTHTTVLLISSLISYRFHGLVHFQYALYPLHGLAPFASAHFQRLVGHILAQFRYLP